NEKTGNLAHTALTAARERARLEKQGNGSGEESSDDSAAATESPASAAQARAASLLEQFRAETQRVGTTLQQGLEALAEAADPESVSSEISAANRAARRSQLEADEAVTA